MEDSGQSKRDDSVLNLAREIAHTRERRMPAVLLKLRGIIVFIRIKEKQMIKTRSKRQIVSYDNKIYWHIFVSKPFQYVGIQNV